jgi:predicted phosphoribosyltransferase
MRFRNRDQATAMLAEALIKWRGQNPLVCAISRGAVPMGRLIAEQLGANSTSC